MIFFSMEPLADISDAPSCGATATGGRRLEGATLRDLDGLMTAVATAGTGGAMTGGATSTFVCDAGKGGATAGDGGSTGSAGAVSRAVAGSVAGTNFGVASTGAAGVNADCGCASLDDAVFAVASLFAGMGSAEGS